MQLNNQHYQNVMLAIGIMQKGEQTTISLRHLECLTASLQEYDNTHYKSYYAKQKPLLHLCRISYSLHPF
jgi:hypothetical protein